MVEYCPSQIMKRGFPNRENRTLRHRGQLPRDDIDRDWSGAAPRQGTPRISENFQKLGRRHRADSSSGSSDGTNLAILILNFTLPVVTEYISADLNMLGCWALL